MRQLVQNTLFGVQNQAIHAQWVVGCILVWYSQFNEIVK